MRYVALASEDELSEAVGRKLLAELPGNVVAEPTIRRGGFGYLKSRIDSWCQIAAAQPILLLTDLDNKPCASALLTAWLGTRVRPENLIFRIAVRQIESWLLADHDAMRKLIGLRGRLPKEPDALLRLARKSPTSTRQMILRQRGAIASQGIGYNSVLSQWVDSTWSAERASHRSPSLDRARIRLGELVERMW
jgi:hypothetical protein